MTTLSSAPISLEDAKTLVALIEQGENQRAQALLVSATGQSSDELFTEVGKLTRQLHDSLNNFQFDARIANMANEDIRDVQSRLMYVIDATEEAANKTMDLVETCMPIAERLHSGIVAVLPDWKNLMSRQLKLGEFNQLCQQLDNILENGRIDTGKLSELLTEVLMAQGYQDLTGQVIRRVIKLVKEVEDNLVYMLTMFGRTESNDKTNSSLDPADSIKAEGPILDAVGREDVVSDQDDVDDLLSSLGF